MLLLDEDVLAEPVRLAAGGAVHGRRASLAVAVFLHQLVVHHQLHAALVGVGRVVERDGHGGVPVAVLQRVPVHEIPVDGVGRAHQHVRVRGAVLHGHHRPSAVVDRGAEVAQHAVQGRLGVSRLGDDAGEPEPRLGAALSVVDEDVVELRDRVQRPLGGGEVLLGHVLAEPVTARGQDVVEAPGAVVGPGVGERAVPHAGVLAGVRIVVARDLHDAPVHLIRPLQRRVGKLVRLGHDAHQGAVRVALAHFGDLVQAHPVEIVLDLVGGRVRVGARDAHGVGGIPVQRDPPGQFRRPVGLVRDRLLDHGGERAARGLHLDPEAHRGAERVAGLDGADEPRKPQRHPRAVALVLDRPCDRGAVLDLGGEAVRGLGVRNALQRLLVRGAGPELDRHALDVEAAVGVLHRRAVVADEHAFQPVNQAADGAFADEVHRAQRGARLKRHGALHGAAGLAAAAAVAAVVVRPIVLVGVPVPVLPVRFCELHAFGRDAGACERGPHADGAAVDQRYAPALGGGVDRAGEQIRGAIGRVLGLLVVGDVGDLRERVGGGEQAQAHGDPRARVGLALDVGANVQRPALPDPQIQRLLHQRLVVEREHPPVVFQLLGEPRQQHAAGVDRFRHRHDVQRKRSARLHICVHLCAL